MQKVMEDRDFSVDKVEIVSENEVRRGNSNCTEKSLRAALASAEQELLDIRKDLVERRNEVISLRKELELKEQRIVHLDRVKLTKGQLEKIKEFKEDRKKFQTQLIRSHQLLKECAVQLKEYEDDRNGIVNVLERYHIDTRNLIPLEHSEDGDGSALYIDIADAVAQLGMLFEEARCVTTTGSTPLAELEKAGKIPTDRSSEKHANAINTLVAEIEAIGVNVTSLKAELARDDGFLFYAESPQEPNAELLRENKELRALVARLKAAQLTTEYEL